MKSGIRGLVVTALAQATSRYQPDRCLRRWSLRFTFFEARFACRGLVRSDNQAMAESVSSKEHRSRVMKPSRMRFRFSLAALMALVFIAAVACYYLRMSQVLTP
jgi:hypothetical protein